MNDLSRLAGEAWRRTARRLAWSRTLSDAASERLTPGLETDFRKASEAHAIDLDRIAMPLEPLGEVVLKLGLAADAEAIERAIRIVLVNAKREGQQACGRQHVVATRDDLGRPETAFTLDAQGHGRRLRTADLDRPCARPGRLGAASA